MSSFGKSAATVYDGGKSTITLSIWAQLDASWGKERSDETTENFSETRPSLSQSSPTSGRRRHLKPCLSNQREMKLVWFFLASAVGVPSG